MSAIRVSGATLARTHPTPPELLYPKHNDHLALAGCDDVTIQGLSVRGLNTAGDYLSTQPFEAGIYLDRCDRATVTGYSSVATFGDGFYARGDDITLDGFDIDLNGRQGVAFTVGARFKALHGIIRNSRRSGIDLEPNTSSEVIEDVELGWVSILRTRLLPITAGGQGAVRRVWVHDIDLGHTGVPVLNANGNGPRDDWTVERLRHIEAEGQMPALGSPAPAMRFAHANNVNIRDCELNFTPGREMTAIWLNDVGGRVEITGNRFTGAAHLVEIVNPRPDLELILDDNTPEN